MVNQCLSTHTLPFLYNRYPSWFRQHPWMNSQIDVRPPPTSGFCVMMSRIQNPSSETPRLPLVSMLQELCRIHNCTAVESHDNSAKGDAFFLSGTSKGGFCSCGKNFFLPPLSLLAEMTEDRMQIHILSLDI